MAWCKSCYFHIIGCTLASIGFCHLQRSGVHTVGQIQYWNDEGGTSVCNPADFIGQYWVGQLRLQNLRKVRTIANSFNSVALSKRMAQKCTQSNQTRSCCSCHQTAAQGYQSQECQLSSSKVPKHEPVTGFFVPPPSHSILII